MADDAGSAPPVQPRRRRRADGRPTKAEIRWRVRTLAEALETLGMTAGAVRMDPDGTITVLDKTAAIHSLSEEDEWLGE